MPHSGSVFSTSPNVCCDARYQNECWYSIPLSNSFCASGLHDVSKCTVPSLVSSDCPSAGCANESPTAAVAAIANGVFIMIWLQVCSECPLSAAQIRPNSRGRLCISPCLGGGSKYRRGLQRIQAVCAASF